MRVLGPPQHSRHVLPHSPGTWERDIQVWTGPCPLHRVQERVPPAASAPGGCWPSWLIAVLL